MPGAETSGGAGEVPPPPNRELPEVKSSRAYIDRAFVRLNVRKAFVSPHTPSDKIALIPIEDVVKAENRLTEPEDIFLGKYGEIKDLALRLRQSQVEPPQSEFDEPLRRKINENLSQVDIQEVSDQYMYDISIQTSNRRWQRTQPPVEQADWEKRWRDFIDNNRDTIDPASTRAIKNMGRNELAHEIKALKDGEKVEDISEAAIQTLSKHQFSPTDFKDDQIIQRFRDVFTSMGGNFDIVKAAVHQEVKEYLTSAVALEEIGVPLSSWAKEWQNDDEFKKWLADSDALPTGSVDSVDASAGVPIPTADTTHTVESGELLEKNRINEQRAETNDFLIQIFEDKINNFPGYTEMVDYQNITLHQLNEKRSANRNQTFEAIASKTSHDAQDIAKKLEDCRVIPDQDALYTQLNDALAPADRKKVLDILQDNIYRRIFNPRPGVLTVYSSDPQWLDRWKEYFVANPDVVKELKWQSEIRHSTGYMLEEMQKLRRGDPQNPGFIARQLEKCKLTPSQFDTDPMLAELKNIVGDDKWQEVEVSYFQLFSLKDPASITISTDSADLVTNPFAFPQSKEDIYALAWAQDPRVAQIRNATASPEVVASPSTSRFGQLIENVSSRIRPYLDMGLNKIKTVNKTEILFNKPVDFFLGFLLTEGIKWGVTSTLGPAAALGIGFAEGSYRGFSRANQKYEKDLKARADAGDHHARNEYNDFRRSITKKENIIKKELGTKSIEAFKRFKKMSAKDKKDLAVATAMGGVIGAAGGYLGAQNAEKFMQGDLSVYEKIVNWTYDKYFRLDTWTS